MSTTRFPYLFIYYIPIGGEDLSPLLPCGKIALKSVPPTLFQIIEVKTSLFQSR